MSHSGGHSHHHRLHASQGEHGHHRPATLGKALAAFADGHVAVVVPYGASAKAYRMAPSVAAGLAVVCTVAVLWSLVSASYLVFKDEVLRRVAHEHNQTIAAYEDRIAELRNQLDRSTSRQLVDQDSVERKLDNLARRQVILETRQSVVSSLGEAVGLATPKPQTPGALPVDAQGFLPLRMGEPEARNKAPQRQSSLSPFGGEMLSLDDIRARARANVHAALERLETSVTGIESQQGETLARISKRADERLVSVRQVFADLGLPLPKTVDRTGAPFLASGGPLVPLASLPSDTASFENGAYRIQAAAHMTEQLKNTLARVPLGRPVDGEMDLTSGFGARIDPFLKTWAMHTGLDFKAETGDPVHATAAGTITTAEYTGGYGKMVEIDHGNGLATRYGHLSKIDVFEGQTVKAGQTIGRAGSTGRSTGPHVHYETRINGDAVDPLRFLRAATKVARVMQ